MRSNQKPNRDPGKKELAVRQAASANGRGVAQPCRGAVGCGRHDPRRRRGIAAVELALCLPFLLVLALGAIETCNLMYVRTRMYSAAYEAARLATRPATATKASATASDVTNRCSTLLTQLGVRGGQPTLSVKDRSTSQAKDLSAAKAQDLVTVTVTASLTQNCVTAFVLKDAMTLSAKATLIVE